MPPSVLRIAHRGMPRRFPENTLPSFEAALDAGADGIELDVHATADGMVVVHHDPLLRGGAEIRRTSWARLSEHRVAPGVGVPTLHDVCRLVGDRAELFVEVKGAGIGDAVAAVLDAHGCSAAIHGFDHAQIGRLATRGTPYRLGLLFDAAPDDACGSLRRYGALDLWPEGRLVTEQMVRDVHAMGGRVLPWTVNEPSVAAVLSGWGVDGLCTDDVSMLR